MYRQIKLVFLIVGLACSSSLYAQIPAKQRFKENNTKPESNKTPVKKPKPFTKEFSIGGKLTTDGYGLFVEKGWVRSEDSKSSDKFYDTRVFRIELVEHKNNKEIKQTNSDLVTNDKPKPYIYGKINNFYALKFSYGNRRMIAGKPEQGTVSIHWVYNGGLSLGFLKPYYLDAYVSKDNVTYTRENIKYDSSTAASFLNTQLVVGNAGWAKGLGETKFIPGLYGSTALHFDFAASAKTVMAIEAGISAELYTKKIELMANQKAYPYLFCAYVSLQFGNRH